MLFRRYANGHIDKQIHKQTPLLPGAEIPNTILLIVSTRITHLLISLPFTVPTAFPLQPSRLSVDNFVDYYFLNLFVPF